jgi:hypothetical protein
LIHEASTERKQTIIERRPATIHGSPQIGRDALACHASHRHRPQVAIVGVASSAGGAAVTTPLSVARADRLKTLLVAGRIDASRIGTSGVGSRRPFADETSPEKSQGRGVSLPPISATIVAAGSVGDGDEPVGWRARGLRT